MAARIEDAGQELEGNRRGKKFLSWQHIYEMDPALRSTFAVKAKIWPRPDYEELVAAGMHEVAARCLKHVYDGIAAKPSTVSDEALERYVNAVTHLRETVPQWFQDRSNLRALVGQSTNSLKSLMGVEQAEQDALSGRSVNISTLIPVAPNTRTTDLLLNAIWPELTSYPPGVSRFRNGKPAEDVRAMGGKRILSRLQITPYDLSDFLKEVKDGWPAKKAAWQVQGYLIAQKVTASIDSNRFQDQVNFYVSVDTDDKQSILLHRAQTRDEAQHYIDQLADFLLFDKFKRLVAQAPTHADIVTAAQAQITHKAKVWQPEPIPVDALKREGPDWRQGQDMSPEHTLAHFGFKGVNFGNWVPQVERQRLLNASHDSFCDQAAVLGTSPDQIGRHGWLGLAIGAQGSGGQAQGHFIPGLNEINITRFASGGVVSHEFGHSLDHLCARSILGDDARGDKAYLSHIAVNTSLAQRLKREHPQWAATIDAMADVMDTLMNRPQTAQEAQQECQTKLERHRKNTRSWARTLLETVPKDDANRPALQATIDTILQVGLRPLQSSQDYRLIGRMRSATGLIHPDVCDLYDQVCAASTTKVSTDNFIGFANNAALMSKCLPGGTTYLEITGTQRVVPTHYYQASQTMDAGKSEPYWSEPCELFARAFADWTRVKLQDRGQLNEHLACDNYASYAAAMQLALVPANPHLSPEELPAAIQAIDRLIPLLPLQRQDDLQADLQEQSDVCHLRQRA